MEASVLQPIIDALQFIKYTDRVIGNKFEAALKEWKRDMDDSEPESYEPSTDTERALNELALEIKDALEKLESDDDDVKLLNEVAAVEAEVEQVNADAEVDLEDNGLKGYEEDDDDLDRALDLEEKEEPAS